MEEDRLKDIFNKYEPELSSLMDFMQRLEQNLNAVEMIHKENERSMKRNRLAVYMASATGFVAGALFSMFLPWLDGLLTSLRLHIASLLPGINDYAGYQPVAAWLIVGAVSVFSAVYSYDILISLRPLRGGMRGD